MRCFLYWMFRLVKREGLDGWCFIGGVWITVVILKGRSVFFRLMKDTYYRN